MYIIVDDRESVANSYIDGLVREGVSSFGFSCSGFRDWLQSASDSDLAAIDAFLLGDFEVSNRIHVRPLFGVGPSGVIIASEFTAQRSERR